MPLNNPKGGLGYAAEFQSAALPWVTASAATVTPQQYTFKKVARFVCLTNTSTGSTIRLGFTQAGVNGTNYLSVPPNMMTSPFEFRVKEVWVRSDSGTASYTLAAGLTNIDDSAMGALTGSAAPNGDPGWEGVG